MPTTQRSFCVYIVTNSRRTVLYIGVTSDLPRRAGEHQEGANAGFTREYQAKHLVYYERYVDAVTAIAREKELKGRSRAGKIALIDAANPEWRDLSHELAEVDNS